MKTLTQSFSLALFSLLFVLAAFTMPDWLPADVYLRLDPLLGASAILGGREWIPRVMWSLIIIGVTLAVGRFFCGYLCPLGAGIDFLDFPFRSQKRPVLEERAWFKKTKFLLLLLFLGSAVAGLSLSFLMDPIPLLTRFYTFFLFPLAITLLNLLLDISRPLFDRLGWMTLSHLHYAQPVFYMAAITFLILWGIIALNRAAPRFWCRYLCPLGALLGLLSPLGFFKRRVSGECNHCGKCQKLCPMDAIGEEPEETHFSECIQCRTCAEGCPKEAIAFSPFRGEWPAKADETGLAAGLSRRGFLYGLGGGLTMGFLADRAPFMPLRSRHKLIRPPGALPESEFLRTCIRCGECMKSCLTNTLQPSLWESGLAGLWTPRTEFRLAGCEQNCNVCGKVCPTQAIRSLSLEEKNHAKVGTAVIRKETCLVWAEDKICLICDEICPYNAIVFRTIEGYRRPVIVPSKCNGCGFCEQKCPVAGEAAITVLPHGEIRLKEGSYKKEADKLQLQFKPDPGDDKFILEEFGLKGEKKETPIPEHQEKKPAGFL